MLGLILAAVVIIASTWMAVGVRIWKRRYGDAGKEKIPSRKSTWQKGREPGLVSLLDEIAQSSTEEEAGRLAIEFFMRELEVSYVSICVATNDGANLRRAIASHGAQVMARIVSLDQSSSSLARCARDGRMVITSNVLSKSDIDLEGFPQFKDCSMMCLPLNQNDGVVLGVLQIVKGCKEGFSNRDISTSEVVSGSLGKQFQILRIQQQVAEVERKSDDIIRMIEEIALGETENTVIAKIIDSVYKMTCSHRVSLFLLERKKNILRLCLSKDAQGKALPADQGIVGRVIQTGKAINVANAYQFPLFDDNMDQATGYQTKSLLCVPIYNRNKEIIGAIQAINKFRPCACHGWRNGAESCYAPCNIENFTAKDGKVLESIAAMAGISIQRATLLQEAMRSNAKANALASIVRHASTLGGSQMKRSKHISRLLEMSRETTNSEMAALYMLDKANQELWCVESNMVTKGHRIRVGQGPVGWVAQTNQHILLPEVRPEKELPYLHDNATLGIDGNEFKLRDMICVPMVDLNNELLAVLQVANKSMPRHTFRCEVLNDFWHLHHHKYDEVDMEILQTAVLEILIMLERLSYDMMLSNAIEGRARSTSEDDKLSSFLKDFSGREDHTIVQPRASRTRRPSIELVKKLTCEGFGAEYSKWKSFSTWDFDAWEVKLDDMPEFVLRSFCDAHLVRTFNLDIEVLSNFVMDILHLYRKDVKFHNAHHALAVFHASKMIIQTTNVPLIPLQTFATFVAALSHDVDHPGFTNHFLIDSGSELALLYNDVSVLENHHIATTFKVLRHEASNITANLTGNEKRVFRSVVVKAILATDMAHHFETIDELKNERLQQRRCQALESVCAHGKANSHQHLRQTDQQFLIDIIVHASDLSGQAYSTPIALKWSYAIAEEFANQSKVEQEMGMELTAYMRNANKPGMIWKLQDDFIRLIIKPFWVELVHVFPELKCCLDNIASNHAFYQEQASSLSKDTAQLETKDT